jgi:hypothetical protein
MAATDLRYAEMLQARTAAVLGNTRMSPRARARILGQPYRLPPAKEHRIIVDIRLGTRRVETIEPPHAAKRNPFQPIELPAAVLPPVPSGVIRVPDAIGRIVCRQAARRILAVVANLWEVRIDDLQGPRKHAELVAARHAAYLLIRERLGYSTPLIGRQLGDRDHTSVLQGIRRAHQRLAAEPDWAAKYDAARKAVAQ